MDWSRGFSSLYYAAIVDPDTWRDVDRLEIIDGSIKRTNSDLLESADISCVNYSATNEQLIRIWLDATQNGDTSHIPLFTGLATSPGRDIEGRLTTNRLQCYSVLKKAQDILLPRGWYAPKDAIGTDLVRGLLKVIGAPIEIAENSPGLKSAIIAESGENNLSMATRILNAINWRMRLTGDGKILISPYNKEPVDKFDNVNNDILEPSVTVEYDWYDCPNVLRAVVDDDYAVARDDDPNSKFSTVSRGREVWYEESDCTLNNNENLTQFAQRRLKECQQVAMEIEYDRRFKPDIYVTDVVEINYPEQKISGYFVITSQSIDLQYGARMSEEVKQI